MNAVPHPVEEEHSADRRPHVERRGVVVARVVATATPISAVPSGPSAASASRGSFGLSPDQQRREHERAEPGQHGNSSPPGGALDDAHERRSRVDRGGADGHDASVVAPLVHL